MEGEFSIAGSRRRFAVIRIADDRQADDLALDILRRTAAKYRKFEERASSLSRFESSINLMTPSQPRQSPEKKVTPDQCKHPRVQIVSRDEDSEYVECQECGDVFESSELKDMIIEEKKEPDEE
jgi:hypothetical protein